MKGINASASEFLQWAHLALQQYGLRAPTVRFLGHSDNLTFRVEEPGGPVYLLRLHYPVTAYFSGIRQHPDVIASELVWLEALAEVGEFQIQRPVRTRHGDLVATVEVDSRGPIPCTLLTWLEGEHFSPASPDATTIVERFGELEARLHEFSAHWSPPAGFNRPRYNLDHFRRIFGHLLRGVDLDIFSEGVYRLLRASSSAILTRIEALEGTPDQWGMIHADLHVGNFLVHDGQVRPIDFALCGSGYYLFDLSVSLVGGLKPALRPVFLDGYRRVRAFPESDLRTVEAFALANQLSYFSYQIDNPAERNWLRQRVPQSAENEHQRFLAGESVYF